MANYAMEHKVPRFTIRDITNREPEFYSVVGPYLSRREIVAELGAPVWDDDGKVWSLAVSEDARVLGFIATKNADICSFWVEPGSRGRLIGSALLYRIVSRATDELRTTATEQAVELFGLFGFTETGQRGRYTIMRRPG